MATSIKSPLPVPLVPITGFQLRGSQTHRRRKMTMPGGFLQPWGQQPGLTVKYWI